MSVGQEMCARLMQNPWAETDEHCALMKELNEVPVSIQEIINTIWCQGLPPGSLL